MHISKLKKLELLVQIASGILAANPDFKNSDLLAEQAADFLSCLIDEAENSIIPRESL